MLPGDREIPHAFRVGETVLHNAAVILQENPLRVRTPPQPWAYAVAFEVQRSAFKTNSGSGRVVVEADLEVEEGEIGLGGLTQDLKEFVAEEETVSAADGRNLARLAISDCDRFFWLMIRNVASAGKPAVFRLHSLKAYESMEPDLSDASASFQSASTDPTVVGDSPFDLGPLRTREQQIEAMDRYLSVLRKKWGEVPAGKLGRRRTSDLVVLPDEQLKAQWLAMHEEATTGEGFTVRGWYQLLYRDVLRGKKVLDVGSGLGIDTIPFARGGASVTFLDIVDTNLDVIRKLCRIFGVTEVSFLHLDTLSSLSTLPEDFDVIWCQGSMINAPFDLMRIESRELLRHLPVGGRWIELAYPRERWEREGSLPFSQWGEKTDGAGTPWMEWYDLEKWRARMHPGALDVVLQLNFHNDDFCWFDCVRRG